MLDRADGTVHGRHDRYVQKGRRNQIGAPAEESEQRGAQPSPQSLAGDEGYGREKDAHRKQHHSDQLTAAAGFFLLADLFRDGFA